MIRRFRNPLRSSSEGNLLDCRNVRSNPVAMSAILLVVALMSAAAATTMVRPVTITGRLTLDGKPLPAGHGVTFMEMQKGYLAFGVTDEDGNFEVKSWNDGNMPVGPYKVLIAPPAARPRTLHNTGRRTV